MEETHRESYLALRICPRASAPDWWNAVRRRDDVPAAVGALLTGRTRVELTATEATQVIAWAGTLDGWVAAEPKPLFIHEPSAEWLAL